MSYKSSGVDVTKADAWVERISESLGAKNSNLVSGVGAYAAVYKMTESHWVALSTDGIGTKLLWGEEGLGRPEDLACDLLAMNANDVLCVGATPKLFLDYLAVGSNKLLEKGAAVDRFIKGLISHCQSSGQLLVGGETAQMPDLYEENSFEVAGFSVGFLEPDEYLSVNGVKAGQSVWGWASSGPHSNGYTWLRRLFSAEKDRSFIENELMKPTRLYVNEFLDLKTSFKKEGFRKSISAAYHITGSGLLNLLRAQPEKGGTIGFDLKNWPSSDPLWVQKIKEKAPSSSSEELFSTFNMGFGFLIVLEEGLSEKAETLLKSKGLVPLGQVINEPVVKVRGLKLS